MLDRFKKLKTAACVSLILIVVSAVFLPCLKNGFVNWDDDLYVTKNPVVQTASSANLKKIFTSILLENYQPLTFLTYLVEYHFFEANPFCYHFTNLALHLLNCFLVFWLIFLISGRTSVACVAAILFGIHPLQVESVVWIAERKNVLYAAFFLGSAISYYYFRKQSSLKFYFFSLLLFILSLLSKSMAVTFPAVLLIMDYSLKRKINKFVFFEKIPYFILSLGAGAIAIFNVYHSGAIRNENTYSFLNAVKIASYGAIFYINKILLPFKLSAFYLFSGMENAPIFLFSVILVGILALCVIISGKYTKKIIFGSIFFLLTIFPVLQFVPYGEIIVADRYVYISIIGIFYIFAEGLLWLYRRETRYSYFVRVLLVAVIITIIFLLSFLTRERIRVWRDGISLWSDVLKKYPKAAAAYINRGLEFHEEKKDFKAYSDFKRAIYYKPKQIKAYLNLGNLYKYIGKNKEAISVFKKVIKIKPENAEAYFNIGNIYDELGRKDEAVSLYEMTIKIDKNHLLGYYYLGLAYEEVNKKEEAIKMFNRAIDLELSHLPSYIALSRLYESLDKKKENTALYKKAIANNLDYFDAYYNLGNLYADTDKNRDAILLYKMAIKINPNSAAAYVGLGTAYCAIGKSKEAVIFLKKAIELNPDLAVAYNNLAVAYYYGKEYGLAIKHCDEAAKLGYKTALNCLSLLEPHRK